MGSVSPGRIASPQGAQGAVVGVAGGPSWRFLGVARVVQRPKFLEIPHSLYQQNLDWTVKGPEMATCLLADRRCRMFVLVCLFSTVRFPQAPAQELSVRPGWSVAGTLCGVTGFQPRSEAAGPRVYKMEIVPHWFDGNNRFWYRNLLPGGTKEFIVVDAVRGLRRPAFDHERMAKALSRATGQSIDAHRLTFDRIEFSPDCRAVVFSHAGQVWSCDLSTYECRPEKSQLLGKEDQSTPDQRDRRARTSGTASSSLQLEAKSPDGQWVAFLKEDNVWLRSAAATQGGTRLSSDGDANYSYRFLEWSPDSRVIVAFRAKQVTIPEVFWIQSSPPGGGRARLLRRPYALPGDAFPTHELTLFHVPTGRVLKPAVEPYEHQWLRPRLTWKRDGRHFLYVQVDRGHQRLRVFEVDTRSGHVHTILEERSDTFIWTAHTENVGLQLVHYLAEADELIYASEFEGWRHLYLFDASCPFPEDAGADPSRIHHTYQGFTPGKQVRGRLKARITQGNWVVRGVDQIDEKGRVVWFYASGVYPDQDPYFLHYGRVRFDGSELLFLTKANGNHRVQFSPDRRFLIATYSRVDQPPIHELRRACDGSVICKLEEADISELRAAAWQPPEVFVAKGRDGTTDIWGIICRPKHFDPNKKYPVLEDIYAGPQTASVPKSFRPEPYYADLTERGFIVVKVDGMGTAHRSKAFHDVCWKNLKDAGFPDRIRWIQSAAEKYPYMDLTRVGIFGNSAGGQNAAAALIFHPSLYKVAVASCGCHDNRLDKASWNEQWLGYVPREKIWEAFLGNPYAENSNIEHAHRLEGKLLLIVGELDQNVPPENTLRFADALIRAAKDFELVVIPNGGHGFGGYGWRKLVHFFVRHLQGCETPSVGRSDTSREGSP
jgi:dipeptidyl aminopeptidase/acylaminoacyl peptidase